MKTELPKALSTEERNDLIVDSEHSHRALTLIDALTAHLAEAVARMTVAEKTRDDYGDGLLDGAEQYAALESERDAALDQAEAAEGAVRVLDLASRGYQQKYERAESEAAALRAENERLRAAHLESQRNGAEVSLKLAALHAENDRLQAEVGQRTGEVFETDTQLAAANALLSRWESQAGGFGPVSLYRDTTRHLAGQPAAPAAPVAK